MKFLDKATGGKNPDAWKNVEKRFNKYAVDGRLSKENFGPCIGEILTFLFRILGSI